MALLIENYLSEEFLRAIGGVFTGYRRSFDGFTFKISSVALHVKNCATPRKNGMTFWEKRNGGGVNRACLILPGRIMQ